MLEVSTSYWNYINEMYSDIRQGEHESTDQLDQCIKNIVKRCQCTNEDEKLVHRTEILFHATKHFEVKKWVRSNKEERGHHIWSTPPTCKRTWDDSQGLQQTQVQWWNHAIATTVDEIKTFKFKKGNTVNRPKSRSGRVCSKCSTSHPPRDCPVFGKKCHKCEWKNHFSTCCRSMHIGAREMATIWDHPELEAQRDITNLETDAPGQDPQSKSNTWSTHSIELCYDQDHNYTVLKMFNTIYRSKSVFSISNETDPDGRTKIVIMLKVKLSHRNVADNMKVKVDNGAEANILPLDSFRSMFSHMHWIRMVTQLKVSSKDPEQVYSTTMMAC